MQSLIAARHSGYPPRVSLLLAGLLLLAARAARAEDLPYLGWTDSLPGLTTQFVPASENNCTVGRTRCVDAVIREMRRHFDPLAASCDHDSIFALAYLRTTEQYRRTIEDPTFFQDTALVNQEDAIFAGDYFKAFDAWCAGRHEAVPPAWPPPSRPPPDHSMPASGNLSLTINAHVERDMPFVPGRTDSQARRLQPQARPRSRQRVPQPARRVPSRPFSCLGSSALRSRGAAHGRTPVRVRPSGRSVPRAVRVTHGAARRRVLT